MDSQNCTHIKVQDIMRSKKDKTIIGKKKSLQSYNYNAVDVVKKMCKCWNGE